MFVTFDDVQNDLLIVFFSPCSVCNVVPKAKEHLYHETTDSNKQHVTPSCCTSVLSVERGYVGFKPVLT